MPIVKCEICGLKTTRVEGKKRIFMAQFPLDEDRCKQWVKVTGKEDLAYVPIEKLHQLKHICGKHFRPKDFKKKKTQLRRNAVLCIEIMAEPLSDEVLTDFLLHIPKTVVLQLDATDPSAPQEFSACIVREHNYCKADDTRITLPTASSVIMGRKRSYCTEPSTSDNLKRKRPCSPEPLTQDLPSTSVNFKTKRPCSPEPLTQDLPSTSVNFKTKRPCSPEPSTSTQKDFDTPRKKKLRKKLKEQKLKIKNLQKDVNQIKKISSPILKSLISACIRNNNRKPQGKRWTRLNKSIAIAIYKKSPKAYRYIKQLLPLPSVRTLQTILQNVQMDPGIYPAVISHLKKEAAKMSENNKLCQLSA